MSLERDERGSGEETAPGKTTQSGLDITVLPHPTRQRWQDGATGAFLYLFLSSLVLFHRRKSGGRLDAM
jgi:hypothetical protein